MTLLIVCLCVCVCLCDIIYSWFWCSMAAYILAAERHSNNPLRIYKNLMRTLHELNVNQVQGQPHPPVKDEQQQARASWSEDHRGVCTSLVSDRAPEKEEKPQNDMLVCDLFCFGDSLSRCCGERIHRPEHLTQSATRRSSRKSSRFAWQLDLPLNRRVGTSYDVHHFYNWLSGVCR